LVGPGGIGKTRLAVEVASRKHDSFPDGAFFVPLASVNRADDVLTTIAEATPFRFQQDNRDPRQQFFDYLREKHARRLLLVMDNFEHLLDGVGIVSEILAVTTNLKILATSREALNLQEEWVRQISGLAYPDTADGKPLEDYSAVQLFLDRARRIRGDFDLVEDSSSVVEICRLVEGMPLAIELAVGWLKAYSDPPTLRTNSNTIWIFWRPVRATCPNGTATSVRCSAIPGVCYLKTNATCSRSCQSSAADSPERQRKSWPARPCIHWPGWSINRWCV
jgi:predicted ATPase